MLRGKYIGFILLIFMYWKPCEFAALPRWVHRVKSCPDTNDINQWIQASKKLNCYHNLTSGDPKEQAVVYHCLASAFLNETVEFCGINVPIAAGNCPVYNYKYGENVAASYYNCSAFTSGCPGEMFHSKNVYRYPECLRINRKEKCFEAKENCSKSPTNPIQQTIKNQTLLDLTSRISMTTEKWDVINIKKMSEKEDNSKTVVYATLSTLVAILLLILIVGGYLYKRKKNHSHLHKSNLLSADEFMELSNSPENRKQNENSVCGSDDSGSVENEVQNGNSVCGSEDCSSNEDHMQTENSSRGSDDSGLELAGENVKPVEKKRKHQKDGLDAVEPADETNPLLENMHEGAKTWRYNGLLKELSKNMTTKVLKRITHQLSERKENREVLKNIKDADKLLDYLNEKYLVFHNVVFLQGLFHATKATKLYDICLKYAKAKDNKMMFFEERILEEDHTKVKYVINCPNVTSYSSSQLEKLRETVVNFTDALYDDVLVYGVKDGCVIVSFMIRNCLIPTLRALYASEEKSMEFQRMIKHKIIKVLIQDDVVYMSDRLSTADQLKTEAELRRTNMQFSLKSTANKVEIHTGDLTEFEHDNLESTEDVKRNFQERTTIEDLATNEQQESQKFKHFLIESFSNMTDKTFKFLKKDLQDFMDEESIRNMDKASLLNEISDLLKLQYNMGYFEWVFEKCGEKELVDKCQKFSFPLKGFKTKLSERLGNQDLEFHIRVLELEPFKTEVQNLRKWLAKTTNVESGKILMTALESNPIVVTYMLEKKPADCLLTFLKTDDGQIAAYRNRVEKVINNGNVFPIEKAINGTRYIQIHVRNRENPPKGWKKKIAVASSRIVEVLGMKMDGKEVYVTPILSDNEDEDNTGEPSGSKAFIEKHWNSLLMNLEPCTLLKNKEFSSCFAKNDIAKIESIDSRQGKTHFLLNECKRLPTGELEKVIPYLKEYVPSSKMTLSTVELDSTLEWIKKNQENLLDEIDSPFIETTVDYMEGVPNKKKALWLDGSKSRKERCRDFLDFVLQRDDGVMALKKTMKENGMLFDKN